MNFFKTCFDLKYRARWAIILAFFCAFASDSLKAQENFKVGDFLEVYSQDSLMVSYNAMGLIKGKKWAKFVRKGKRHPVFMNVTGDFKDYDTQGNLYFKETMLNNYLNGNGSYYYDNGNIQEEGQYKDDIRVGVEREEDL